MRNKLLTPGMKSSVDYMKALRNKEEVPSTLELSLESLSKLEIEFERAKEFHKYKLQKIAEDKKNLINEFIESIPEHLRILRTYKEEFLIILSGQDFTPEETLPFSIECFVKEVSIFPYCSFYNSTFPKRLNPYDEKVMDIEIQRFGICICLHLCEKTKGTKFDISFELRLKNLKIYREKSSIVWNIEGCSSALGSINYETISSSQKMIKKFKEMIGFYEFSKLAMSIL